jgi:hypothetical protein
MEMDQGGMWHTIRAADGSWLQFGDIRGQAGSPGSFVDCSISGNNDTGELHAAGSTSDGRLWHTIRQESGAWLQFGDVTGQAGAPGSFGAVAIGLIGGELHVAGITTTDQKLWHTIRRANGSWGRFADVGGQAGSPGSFADVSIAGNNGTGELHVVGSTSDGSVWHTIRDGSGSWLPFGDVTAQAGTPGSFGHVAIGLVGSDLHVTGVTAADQKVWHTIRDGDGNWDRFGDVTGEAGMPGSFADVSIAGNAATAELQVAASTSDGKVWHTIRDAFGDWLEFGDVTEEAGNPGTCGLGNLAISFIGANLHVAVVTAPCAG